MTDVPGEAIALARRIKDRVRCSTSLTCSIGLAPNKLLAKLASEIEKPDGLTILAHTDLPTCIWPLPARTINGIGPRASAKLEALGIRTIGELATAAEKMLVETFGQRMQVWLLGCRARARRAPSRRADSVYGSIIDLLFLPHADPQIIALSVVHTAPRFIGRSGAGDRRRSAAHSCDSSY
ncbi:MAG: hypothetical protein ACREA0_16445 [bacterium]